MGEDARMERMRERYEEEREQANNEERIEHLESLLEKYQEAHNKAKPFVDFIRGQARTMSATSAEKDWITAYDEASLAE